MTKKIIRIGDHYATVTGPWRRKPEGDAVHPFAIIDGNGSIVATVSALGYRETEAIANLIVDAVNAKIT